MNAIGETFKAIARRVVHMGSYAAIIPAVNINLAGSASHDISVANVGFVLGAAVSLDYAFIQFGQRQKARGALALAACLLFIAINLNNALSNIAHISGAVKDQAQGQMDHAGRLKSDIVAIDAQLATLNGRRDTQDGNANHKTVEGIRHEIDGLTAQNQKMWEASTQCTAINPKSGAQKDLCGKVETMRGQQAAAVERDKIDDLLAQLAADRSAKSEKLDAVGGAPSSADPYADNLQAVLPFFGFHMDDSQKAAAGPLKNWMWAGGLELLAAIGPVFLSGLLIHMLGLGAHLPAPVNPQTHSEKPSILKRSLAPLARLRPNRFRNAKFEEDTAPTSQQTSQADTGETEAHDVVTFRAEKLDNADGEAMTAKEMWLLWCSFCEEKGIPTGTETAFGRNIKRLAHVPFETKSNRTKYLNVRPKRAGLRRVLF